MNDFKKSAKTRLLESLRANNFKNLLTEEDVVFGLPVVTTAHSRNTKVVITPTNPTKHTGKRTIYYNRLDLSGIVTRLGVNGDNLPIVADTHELLPFIAQQFDVLLTKDDIILEVLSGEPYILNAKLTSLGWYGSVTLGVGDGVVFEVLQLDDDTLFMTDGDNLILIDEN